MPHRDLLLVASVLALLRGETTVRGVAERFGVTEAQVARWRDIFEIAGMLALSNVLGQSGGPSPQRRPSGKAERSDPTTKAFSDPTTAPLVYTTTLEPATTKLKRQRGGKSKSKSKSKRRNKGTKSKSKR